MCFVNVNVICDMKAEFAEQRPKQRRTSYHISLITYHNCRLDWYFINLLQFPREKNFYRFSDFSPARRCRGRPQLVQRGPFADDFFRRFFRAVFQFLGRARRRIRAERRAKLYRASPLDRKQPRSARRRPPRRKVRGFRPIRARRRIADNLPRGRRRRGRRIGAYRRDPHRRGL